MPIAITSIYFWALFGTTCCFLWTARPINDCRVDQTVVGTVRFVGQPPSNTVGCYPGALGHRGIYSQRCMPFLIHDLRNEGVETTCNYTVAQLTSEIVQCSYNAEGKYDCEIDRTDHLIYSIDLKLSTTEADLCARTNIIGEQLQWRRGQGFVTLMSAWMRIPEAAPFSVGIRCGENGCGVRDIRLLVVKYRCLSRQSGPAGGF